MKKHIKILIVTIFCLLAGGVLNTSLANDKVVNLSNEQKEYIISEYEKYGESYEDAVEVINLYEKQGFVLSELNDAYPVNITEIEEGVKEVYSDKSIKIKSVSFNKDPKETSNVLEFNDNPNKESITPYGVIVGKVSKTTMSWSSTGNKAKESNIFYSYEFMFDAIYDRNHNMKITKVYKPNFSETLTDGSVSELRIVNNNYAYLGVNRGKRISYLNLYAYSPSNMYTKLER